MRKAITNFLNYWVQYKWKNLSFSSLLKTKLIIFLLLFSCSNSIFGQGLKQTTEQWTNGDPLKVEYLNDDLEVVKEEYFDPNGIKVASYLIDPVTKKYNGSFFDGTNKGTYNQGILTADNFRVFLIDNHQSEITISIKEGIVYGKAIKITYNGPFFSTKSSSAELRNIDGPGFIRYENYINKKHQEFLKERNIKDKYYFSRIYELNYDQNGLLHGDHFIDPNITMIFDHGECLGIMTYDGITGINEFDDNHNFIGVKGYALDSVFRDQKIWKRNFKLIKNCGFIEGYTLPNIYNVDQLRLLSFNAYDYGRVDEDKIFTGQEVFEGQNYPKLKLFNSEASVIPEHIETTLEGQYNENRVNFFFEYRTAALDNLGFFVNRESRSLSVFSAHDEPSNSTFNNWRHTLNGIHFDTIKHSKVRFTLFNLHCWIANYGLNGFHSNIDFYRKPINKFEYRDQMIVCLTGIEKSGEKNSYWESNFLNGTYVPGWLGDIPKLYLFGEESYEEEVKNLKKIAMSYMDKTSFTLLNELRENIGTHKSNELSVNFFFIKKDLKKESDSRDAVEKIRLYSFDEVIDFSVIEEKNKEIIENYEKEKQATKLKIEEICLNLTSGIESENWKVLIDLSKELDRQIALNEKMGYDLSFEDPRTAFLNGGKQDFSAYVNEQIEKQIIRAEYKELKEGLEQIASKLNLKFETNIPTDGDLIELFNRLSIKNKSLPQFLNDVERRLDKMLTSVRENFDGTDKIAFKAVFSDEQKDAGPLHFVLYFDVGKPKNDFLMDKKSLKQEWKSNSPKLIFQFSTENINRIAYLYGNIRFAFEYNQL